MHYPKGKLSLEFVHNGRCLPRGPHTCNRPCNLLLCGLPELRRRRILPLLQPVILTLGQVLYELGEPIRYCYFPTNSVISLLYSMDDGSTAEMGMVGNEGVLGVAVFLAEYPHAAGRWYRCNRPFDQTWYLVKFMPRAGVRRLPRCDLHEASVH